MASIQKRGKKYAVVYTYDDSKGEKKQKWETFITKKEALKRKAAVENEINNGTFIPPSELTVKDFLRDFVELYGTKRWGLSVYASNNGLISNYINPLIGDEIVQDINRRSVDQFIQKLQKTPPIETPYRHARTDFVTPCTIEKIIKLMRCAFHQAVRWDIIGKNPFEDAILPKREKKVRAIWILFEMLSTTARMESCMSQSTWPLPAPCGWAKSPALHGTVFIYQMKKSLGMMPSSGLKKSWPALTRRLSTQLAKRTSSLYSRA